MQPLVRTKLTHDPSSMEGQAYVPMGLFYEVETTGSGTATLFTAPAGMYIEKVIGHIADAFDASTSVDVGYTGSASAFIANNEWTESTVDQIAASSQTTAPDGVYFATAKDIIVTVAGDPDAVGIVRLLFVCWNLTGMAAQGLHGEETV